MLVLLPDRLILVKSLGPISLRGVYTCAKGMQTWQLEMGARENQVQNEPIQYAI